MGLNRTISLVLLILGVAVFAAYYHYNRRGAVEPARFEPLRLRAPMPSGGFLEERIAEIAAQAIEETGRDNRIVQRSSEGETIRIDGAAESVEGAEEGNDSVRGRLKQLASQFAYTRYGKIGDRRLATLMDLRSHETNVVPEGANYRGVEIAQVNEEWVLLTAPGEGELRKPRIELDIAPLSADEQDPEREQALWVRHQELWGNRTEGGAAETPFARGGTALSPDEMERRIQARRAYLEKMSEFHDRLKAEDPTLQPGESPLLPTAEEAARELLQKAQNPQEMDESYRVESDTGGNPEPQ